MNTSNGSSGLWGFLVGLFRFASGVLLFYYLYLFLVWYIKGHFGKYFIFFWAWTILSICLSLYERNRLDREYQEYWTKYGSRSGGELFEESLRSGESYNK